jgi:tRNA threonylcarbamoyladenosine biosynthesis protein TsaE
MAIEVCGLLGSADETFALGARLGAKLNEPLVIALVGEMGSGKTTFVRGLASGLGVADVVNSPTYALMQRYEGRLRLDHYDAWMEGREREVMADGAHELLGLEGVSVIEWADRVVEFLPDGYLEVRLMLLSQTERRITAKWVGAVVTGQGQACLDSILSGLVPESASGG